MTPKEKAKELVGKYQKLDIEIGGQYDGYLTMKIYDAKQCAMIAVDEIINAINSITDKYIELGMRQFWHEVKTEIEKL
jgi:hypothetical protein